MRLLPPLLCAVVIATTLRADEPERSDSTGSSSARVRQALADKLPKFAPTPAVVTDASPADVSVAEPTLPGEYRDELLVLPEFRVTEPKPFSPDADDWLTGKELTRKALRLAERDMTALDLALNRWHIPLLTPSFAARARAAYEQDRLDREMDRLLRLVEIGEALDLETGRQGESPFRFKPEQSIRLNLDLTRRRQ